MANSARALSPNAHGEEIRELTRDGVHGRDGRVIGQLFFDHGLPAAGVTLRAYDMKFGAKGKKVSEGASNAEGYYELKYDVPPRGANIEIRAVGASGKETAISEKLFSADLREVIDLVVPAGATTKREFEFDHLSADLGSQLDKPADLAEATENGERQDITLLSRTTGWDGRLIATAARATALSAESGIDAAALYGAARAGLPSDAQSLSVVGTEAFVRALKRSHDAGIIALSKKQIVAAEARFAQFAVDQALVRVADGTPSSLNDLLAGPKLSKAERAAFARAYLDAAQSGDDLWAEASKAGVPKAKLKALQLQGKLAYLTVNNAELAAELHKDVDSGAGLAGLVESGLYSPSEWKRRLKQLAASSDRSLNQLVPPAYKGGSPSERLNAYANDLAAKVRASFPTEAVAKQLAEGELKLPDQRSSDGVVAFLRKAAPLDYRLGAVPVGEFVDANRDKLFNGRTSEAAAKAVVEQVKTLHRVYQLTPNDEAMAGMLKSDLLAAEHVMEFKLQQFRETYSEALGSEQNADAVYAKAEQVSSVTRNLMVLGGQVSSSPRIYSISGTPQSQQTAQANLIKQFPTMESLFGSMDFCECEHCRSVLSPAAYFVDLLKFVEPSDNVWTSFKNKWRTEHGNAAYPYDKPFKALTKRRPDLPFLQLTCENTNTAMPYIDVVNEILEFYVANNNTLTKDAVRDTVDAKTPELLAEPQNIIATAYGKLKDERYPLNLPFDLWLETVRRFCEHFETPFDDVLETFRPADELFPPTTNAKKYYRSAIFAESLGISPSEYKLLTDANPLQRWFELYGYATEPAALTANTDADGQRTDLNSAKALSRKLGVTYKELVSLVKTGFVNPKLDQLVVLRKLGLDVDDVFRYKGHPSYVPFTPAQTTAFEAKLDALTNQFSGFNARTWLNAAWPAGFNGILVLADPDAGCDFDKTILRYADGSAADSIAFLRLNLFVRLWRKLGWPIDDIDRALQALLPSGSLPLTGANIGAAMKTALAGIASLNDLYGRLKVGKSARQKLLTFWRDMATTGKDPLYAQLFLTPSVLKNDVAFDDPLGNYLSDAGVYLKDHLPAVQGAVNLKAADVPLILASAGLTLDTAKLTLNNVTLLYRHGVLAKALKLPVADILTLKAISGVDPFAAPGSSPFATIADDTPFSGTIAFVELAARVKASGFRAEDLDFLLRGRFDPTGRYRDAADEPLQLIQTLTAGLRQIATQNATPSDPELITDDYLKEKLALVFSPEAVNEFLSYWNDTAEFTATKTAVPPEKKLDPTIYEVFNLRVAYDATRARQLLAHKGVVSAVVKAEILQGVPAPAQNAPQDEKDAYQTFKDLLDTIATESQPKPRAFFEKYFGSFLTYDDLYAAALAPPTNARRQRVINSVLPFVRERLASQLVFDTLAGELSAEPELIESLAGDAAMLVDPASTAQVKPPLLDIFKRLGPNVVTSDLYASADLTGVKLAGSGDAEQLEVATGAGVGSARFGAWFEVTEDGPLRFYGRFGKATAAATVRVQSETLDTTITFAPTQANLEVSQPGDFIELKAGECYRLSVEATGLGDKGFALLVQGETLPKDNIGQLPLYSTTTVERVRVAWVLLRKVNQIAGRLTIGERELRHILTNASDFGGIDLSRLPTSALGDGAPDKARAKQVFEWLMHLVDYSALRSIPAGDTADLIDVFARARATYENLTAEEAKTEHFKTIGELTRREPADVRAAYAALGFTLTATAAGGDQQINAPELANERGVKRLWDALQVIETLGVPVQTILDATDVIAESTTDAQRFAAARELRNAVKAGFDPEIWQRMARPIFDKLRQKQRDALVAHIMHAKKFARIEQLFEYFLIDPGMEPVVQTSRLRLAISSVQLFVQRCLLNLENEVNPAAIINAEQWDYLKRYRFWEANRKIFLFPEDWLEPEFRDDKTHLFQAFEGQVLQGDISNDLAEDAFVAYLKSLDELARLDIVAMHMEQKADPAHNVLHVIGRTHNLPQKYFYRRFAHRQWTPWEPVGADIEGDHLAVTIWKQRLQLLWLTFLEKPQEDTNPSATKLNAGMSAPARPHVKVDIQLNWSELANGEWSTRSASGFSDPLSIEIVGQFDPAHGTIHAYVQRKPDGSEGAMVVSMHGSLAFYVGYVDSPMFGGTPVAFRIVSKNSAPEKHNGTREVKPAYVINPARTGPTRYIGEEKLRVARTEPQQNKPSKVDAILNDPRDIFNPYYSVLTPEHTKVMDTPYEERLASPFFYADSENTFFVQPTLTFETVTDYEWFGVDRPGEKNLYTDDIWQHLPVKVDFVGPKKPEPGDPRAKFQIDTTNDWLTHSGTVVDFDGVAIGKAGGMPEVAIESGTIVGTGGVNTTIIAERAEQAQNGTQYGNEYGSPNGYGVPQ
ncbi:MAG: neuraminidase-like domain-containing protein [Solirubrobacterales bacterium]